MATTARGSRPLLTIEQRLSHDCSGFEPSLIRVTFASRSLRRRSSGTKSPIVAIRDAALFGQRDNRWFDVVRDISVDAAERA
jgi:hypothetical protein